MPTLRTHIEIEFEVDYTVVSRGHAGGLSGPAEHCEPPESPEIEVGEVRVVRRAPAERMVGRDGRVRTIAGRVLSATALLLPAHLLEEIETGILENWDDES